MSLATRCPDCATYFLLLPDQLRVAGGWVRCGQCDSVFNAAAQLERRTVDSDFLGFHPAASTRLPEAKHLERLPCLSVAAEKGSSAAAKPHVDDAPAASAPASVFSKEREPQPIATPILRPALDGENRAQHERALHAPRQPNDKDEPRDRSRPAPPREKPLQAPTLDGATIPDPLELSFMRKAAEAPELPPRKALGLVVRAVALLLALGLIMQIVLTQRDRIAARAPAVAPGLHALCAALGCTVEPARQIDALVVEHSSLNKRAAGEYRLQLALRNRSGMELAMPAVELSLTDLQDRPVLRRTLLPSEIGADPTISARGEWRGAVTLAVAAGEPGRIVGYKVLAFYP